jgi:RNA polymerase sigma-70 factor (ECF subfamily)
MFEELEVVEDPAITYHPDIQTLLNERSEFIQKGLNQLSGVQKEAIILRFYHDMKIKDIAQITGVSIPTAKSRLKQAIHKLRLHLDKEEYF